MKGTPILIDSGLLVALLSARDQWHEWAVAQAKTLPLPCNTCEAGLSETFFLLSKVPEGTTKLLAPLRRPGLVAIPWTMEQNRAPVLGIYRDPPTSLADVSLVCMADAEKSLLVWTTDQHLHIYRVGKGAKIPLLSPTR